MAKIVSAGLAYFLIAFAAGFALGVLRTLVIGPSIGETAAVAAELPMMLAICWIGARSLSARYTIAPALSARLAMGALALLLLLAAEYGVARFGMGRTLAEHLASYANAPQALGLAGQLLFALFPALQAMRR